MSRVGLIGDNSIEYICTLIDIWNNGDCAVLIDWRIPNQTAIEMMREASVEKCYIERKFFKNFEDSANKDISLIPYVNDANAEKLLPKSVYSNFHENYSSNEAVVIYSSGTTGKSKGVILSHYAISKNADAIQNYMQAGKGDVFCIVKSLFHSSTLIGELLVALKEDVPLVIIPEMASITYLFNAIPKYKVSIMCVNPTLLAIYSREYKTRRITLPTLRKIYVSGSVLNENSLQTARSIFDNVEIFNVYGLTEAGPRVSAQRKDCCHGASVGKPINGVSVKVVNENGVENNVGEKGYIYVKTPCRFMKYVTSNNEQNPIVNDWLNTGDVGFIDNNRELVVVGRNDTSIIHRSHKIYPEEVESILMETNHFIECLIEGDDSKLICYYVSTKKKPLQFEELRAIVRQSSEKLAPYEIPHEFICVEKLHRNSIGKLIRKRMSQ